MVALRQQESSYLKMSGWLVPAISSHPVSIIGSANRHFLAVAARHYRVCFVHPACSIGFDPNSDVAFFCLENKRVRIFRWLQDAEWPPFETRLSTLLDFLVRIHAVP